LSNIAASTTNTTVTVSWDIDQPATGQFEYGPTTAYGSFSKPESSFNFRRHAQTVSALSPGTAYHYRVKSKNAAGQETTSNDATFTTLGANAQDAGPLTDAGVSRDAGVSIDAGVGVPMAFLTALTGFGAFISGDPGHANASGFTSATLGGFQPQHPSVGGYNANGTLLATHSGPIYKTSDASQMGSFIDNSQIAIKQWSNVDPQKMYYLTATDCTSHLVDGTSQTVFDLASARRAFNINFDKFWATSIEGSFIVGPDTAIAIFGISGTQAYALVWKFGVGWLPTSYRMPETYTSQGWDLFATTPIGDPKVPGNLGYLYVKPIVQGGSNSSWAIISITNSGAVSRVNSNFTQANHATQCVWQDTDGSFRPGLVEAEGHVIAGDGTDFTFPIGGILWHLGWVRGTTFVCADQIQGSSNVGASAYALRKSNQGGYRILGSGLNGGYPGIYANNGIANVNFKDSNADRVIMWRR
jgi:hypothetical protein